MVHFEVPGDTKPIENLPLSTVKITFNKDLGINIIKGDWIQLSTIVDTSKTQEIKESIAKSYPHEEPWLADTIQYRQYFANVLTMSSRKIVKDEIVATIESASQCQYRSKSSVDTLAWTIKPNKVPKVTYPFNFMLQFIEKRYETPDIQILSGTRSNGSIARELFFMKSIVINNLWFSSEISSIKRENYNYGIILEIEIDAAGAVKSCKINNEKQYEFYTTLIENIQSCTFSPMPHQKENTQFRYNLPISSL